MDRCWACSIFASDIRHNFVVIYTHTSTARASTAQATYHFLSIRVAKGGFINYASTDGIVYCCPFYVMHLIRNSGNS